MPGGGVAAALGFGNNPLGCQCGYSGGRCVICNAGACPFGSNQDGSCINPNTPTNTGGALNSLQTFLANSGGILPPPNSDIAIAYKIYPPTSTPIMNNLTNSLQTSFVNTHPGLLLLGLGALILLALR
jgi:hypothetical protein